MTCYDTIYMAMQCCNAQVALGVPAGFGELSRQEGKPCTKGLRLNDYMPCMLCLMTAARTKRLQGTRGRVNL
eukprot:3102821-Amphidinium_carterae.1